MNALLFIYCIISYYHLLFAVGMIFFGSTTTTSTTDDEEFGGDKKATTSTVKSTTTTSYGLDVSFPVQRPVSTNYEWLPFNQKDSTVSVPFAYENMPIQPLGDRRTEYLKHLQGCRKAYGQQPEACDQYEYHRMLMNLRQPCSMKNYTESGYLKTKAPDDVIQLIETFWRQNHYKGKPEEWAPGNSYINHWDSPTYLVSVDDTTLRGSGAKLKTKIWSASSAILEAWTGEELQPVSMYGIRVYGEGAIMLPHVDRLPLVASAMICVHSDVDEDWPTEVYHHQTGLAYNVTLQPGEMLLFESHSTIHGHPFPLIGRSYALLFIHFELTGNTLKTNTKNDADNNNNNALDNVYQKYKDAVSSLQAGPKHDGDLPPYIQKESPEEENWRREHPAGWTPPATILPPEAHVAAKEGRLEELRKQLEVDSTLLTERDAHGYQVLHASVEAGNKDVVEWLVDHGAEWNTRTHGGYGETPLRIAERKLGNEHPITAYLRSLGALSLGPEL